MNFIAAVSTFAFLAAQTQGADFQMSENREVTVCMERNSDPTIFRAQAIASDIYKRIGIRIRWSHHPPGCTLARNRIVVNVIDETPGTLHPGSLAISAPYQGKEIALYYDRVLAIGLNESAMLLGYVLAHEIAHIAQGIARHSDEGLLKSHWDRRDRALMRHAALRFTDADIDLIRRGLDGGHEFQSTLQRGSTGMLGPQ